MLSTLALCTVAAAFLVQEENDLLVLQDGQEISCRVLYEDGHKVIARSRRRNRQFARDEVARIYSIERSLREFLERMRSIPLEDVNALAELAEFCEQYELPGEARHLWIRTLTVDPENERAWTKLGGSHGPQGWRLEVRGRYYTLEALRARVADWQNAMELETAHFLLKTDVQLEWALDVAIDLERAYLQFYDLLGPHLELYVFDEVPEIHVFRNADDYPTPPTPPTPRNAWFSSVANTLYVNASENRDTQEIVRNLTDLLLFNAFRHTLGRTGSVAPWARRGLAEAFGAAYRRDSGQARWELGRPHVPYFRFQAEDPRPLDLDEVLRAGPACFESGPEAARYIAQSYTLAFFLVHGASGKYRHAFAEFLVSSYRGQDSKSHFEKILDVGLDDLEAEWTAFVREAAG